MGHTVKMQNDRPTEIPRALDNWSDSAQSVTLPAIFRLSKIIDDLETCSKETFYLSKNKTTWTVIYCE